MSGVMSGVLAEPIRANLLLLSQALSEYSFNESRYPERRFQSPFRAQSLPPPSRLSEPPVPRMPQTNNPSLNIPPYATPISGSSTRITVQTQSPNVSTSPASPSRPQGPGAPLKSFNLSQLMLSGLSPSSPAPHPSSPRTDQSAKNLITTRSALSIPTTTVNFRRFVSRSGVIFWVQDRIEEVIMWKRGWKVTAAWMAGYAFLCCFPRVILLAPHAVCLGVLLSTYSTRYPPSTEDVPASPYVMPLPSEGSSEWYANLQAIQNLMGFLSDIYDTAQYWIPHLTHSSIYAVLLTRSLLVSALVLLCILPYIPLRPLFLVIGLLPFVLTHPDVRALASHPVRPKLEKQARNVLDRLRNEDALQEKHWIAREGGDQQWGEMETWQREVWRAEDDTKQWCSEGGRSPWEVALKPGWAFVESESWLLDALGAWSSVGADEEGWVYSDSSWQHPVPLPVREGDTLITTTRRRRWTHRTYRPSQPGPQTKKT